MLCLVLAAAALPGCSYWKSYKTHRAYAKYQNALAAGDMNAARIALITLVRTDQDVAAYWLELGKLQIQSGDYRGAYDAFSHAHELDRTNVEVLGTMAQLALLSGQMDVADEQARTLALLAPDNPAVTLVKGYVALKSGELDKAESGADELLAATPNDPFAMILKARVLIARHQPDRAIALLEEQHQAVPNDSGATRTLISLYQSQNDWKDIARIQADVQKLDPKDPERSRFLVEARLRAGDLSGAQKASAPLLTGSADPQMVQAVLDLWSRYAPAGVVLPIAMEGRDWSNDRKVSFADYLNGAGRPATATALLGKSELPVTHDNARWNAVFAQSLALQGRTAEAKRLFDTVLRVEPDQTQGLRGRSALASRIGLGKQAVLDAQRLVTLRPDSGQDRLLLARAFLASGNKREVLRTLWQSFQELPDDERVYAALRSVLISTGDVDGQRRLEDEFADRRNSVLTKDVI